MIVVDDASTDKTPFIVEEYARKDNRIKFIRNEKNNGPLLLDVNYNAALREANGEWIGYLEGDDVFTPKSLEHRVKALSDLTESKRKNISLVHGGYGRIWMDKKIVDRTYIYFESYPNIINNKPIGQALLAFLQGINFIASGSIFINREKIFKIGGFKQYPPEIMAADYCTWSHLSLEGEFLYVPKLLYFWRRHSTSITMQHHEEIMRNTLSFVEFFWKNNEDRIKYVIPYKYFENCLGILAKLELAKIKAIKGYYKDSLQLLKEVELCPYLDGVIPDIFRKKFFVTKVASKFKLGLLARFSLNLKKKIYDKKLGDYKPFFFKELYDID